MKAEDKKAIYAAIRIVKKEIANPKKHSTLYEDLLYIDELEGVVKTLEKLKTT
ncbi:MAG: hypothetical protein QG594_2327 [Bacteroidota bacterium]|jgi:hypothetical protein|nr:hypothetical protein [Bacteroidota bacterium]